MESTQVTLVELGVRTATAMQGLFEPIRDRWTDFEPAQRAHDVRKGRA